VQGTQVLLLRLKVFQVLAGSYDPRASSSWLPGLDSIFLWKIPRSAFSTPFESKSVSSSLPLQTAGIGLIPLFLIRFAHKNAGRASRLFAQVLRSQHRSGGSNPTKSAQALF